MLRTSITTRRSLLPPTAGPFTYPAYSDQSSAYPGQIFVLLDSETRHETNGEGCSVSLAMPRSILACGLSAGFFGCKCPLDIDSMDSDFTKINQYGIDILSLPDLGAKPLGERTGLS